MSSSNRSCVRVIHCTRFNQSFLAASPFDGLSSRKWASPLYLAGGDGDSLVASFISFDFIFLAEPCELFYAFVHGS